MNPLIDAATSANDFDLRMVRKRRMSIYLGVTPDNLERMTPILNLFFQQLIDLNTRELPAQNPDIKYSCLLLMDEFTAIGKINTLSKGIAYMAGYGLRMLPIIQSPSQLIDTYGKEAAQTFMTNHALNIIFPPKASETQTARDISEWLGYQTVKGKSQSKNKALFSKQSPTENTSDQRRALLLPQEITSLPQNRALVIMEHLPPILAQKVQYYNDPVFIDRLKEVSPSLKKLGAKLPSHQQLETAIQTGELSTPVPLLNIKAHHQLIAMDAPINDIQKTSKERPVTPDDLPKLAKLHLANFAVDFSAVAKPKHENLDVAGVLDYADNLCIAAGITVKSDPDPELN
jgi:type IV secretion system protein VirD4